LSVWDRLLPIHQELIDGRLSPTWGWRSTTPTDDHRRLLDAALVPCRLLLLINTGRCVRRDTAIELRRLNLISSSEVAVTN
ncbi:unnamed protein product, partial [Clonostachys rosea f. rosea IK726]